MAHYAVVDFAGHGFQFGLSRALARRGHRVTHTWCSSNVTPHGDLRDGEGVTAVPISTGTTFEKYRLGSRLRSELVYGFGTARLLRRSRPDAVLTSNVPLVSLLVIAVSARLIGARWVLWLQDLQSGLAESAAATGGGVVGAILRVIEHQLVRRADEVVVIDEAFVAPVAAARDSVPPVIRNWAEIDDLPPRPKDNGWAREHGIDPAGLVVLYAGTLGRKHPPELVLALAEELPDAQVVVVSEGEGVDRLEAIRAERGVSNLVVLGFQPHRRLADVLGAADVLVAVLSESAGGCSVPSKVLSYLCAGRAILAAMPAENGAARLVAGVAEAGIVVAPTPDAIRWGARTLAEHPALRERFATAGRAFAEASFDVDRKAEEFDGLLAPGTPRRSDDGAVPAEVPPSVVVAGEG